MNEYIKKWQQRKNNVFPGDDLILKERYSVIYKTPEEFINSSSLNDSKDNKYHLGLSPLPFLGNLSRASVFILTLNPGLHISDYFTENNPVFQKHLGENFNQTLDKYPLFFLNPELGFHMGFEYWNQEIKHLREEICGQTKESRGFVQQFLAREMAVLELIPYHAQSRPIQNKSILSLPSIRAVITFVKTVLQPNALNGEILILNLRAIGNWGLKNGENIVKFTNNRNPSLNPKYPKGKQLLKFLLTRFKS